MIKDQRRLNLSSCYNGFKSRFISIVIRKLKLNLRVKKMALVNELGQRMCILSPSNSGKLKQATELGEKLGISVCHLDQLAHIPGTNWERICCGSGFFPCKGSWIIHSM
jgi:hypothetical protein